MTIDKILLIASSIIKIDEKVLLLQRSEDSSFSSHWQLPEGKLEINENPNEALKRELREEINGKIKNMKLLMVFTNNLRVKNLNYLGIRIVYKVTLISNEVTLSHEHKDFGWFTKKQSLNLPLLPGIKEVLDKLA